MNLLNIDDIDIEWNPEDVSTNALALDFPALHPDNPAEIGYPPTLPLEIALNVAPVAQILAAYGISDYRWEQIRFDPAFQASVHAAQEMLRKEGMSFRLKAKLQAEELLKTTWAIIHDPDTTPQVKADLIKATVRWAGYDAPDAAHSAGTGFNIVINFKNEPKLIEG